MICSPDVPIISYDMFPRCIQIRNLHKVYTSKKASCCAVNSLQLTLYENQILALLGKHHIIIFHIFGDNIAAQMTHLGFEVSCLNPFFIGESLGGHLVLLMGQIRLIG